MGPPEKFLADNGEGFCEFKFVEPAEAVNAQILKTAAYSPWSNGLVEQYSATLGEILHKVFADGSDMESALGWAIHAKNSLDNERILTSSASIWPKSLSSHDNECKASCPGKLLSGGGS